MDRKGFVSVSVPTTVNPPVGAGWWKPAAAQTFRCRPNVFQAKLRGRGRATTRIVARRLPRILLDSKA
jgi:hypothetical protein